MILYVAIRFSTCFKNFIDRNTKVKKSSNNTEQKVQFIALPNLNLEILRENNEATAFIQSSSTSQQMH